MLNKIVNSIFCMNHLLPTVSGTPQGWTTCADRQRNAARLDNLRRIRSE
jgi:hypothetical protein